MSAIINIIFNFLWKIKGKFFYFALLYFVLYIFANFFSLYLTVLFYHLAFALAYIGWIVWVSFAGGFSLLMLYFLPEILKTLQKVFNFLTK